MQNCHPHKPLPNDIRTWWMSYLPVTDDKAFQSLSLGGSRYRLSFCNLPNGIFLNWMLMSVGIAKEIHKRKEHLWNRAHLWKRLVLIDSTVFKVLKIIFTDNLFHEIQFSLAKQETTKQQISLRHVLNV